MTDSRRFVRGFTLLELLVVIAIIAFLVVLLMPFLEQQALFDSFSFSVPINHSANRTPRGADLAVMRCPADDGRIPKFGIANVEGDNWSRGNYASNSSLAFGLSTTREDRGIHDYSGAGMDSKPAYSRWHRGIMGSNLSMGTSEVYDGTSVTMLIAEIRVGLTARDRRGIWAMSGCNSSALYAHGWGDALGPNPCGIWVDDMLGCDDVIAALGDRAVQSQCMTCSPESNRQQAVRSQPPGGACVVMADGAVHFISNYIETGTQSQGYWAATPNSKTQFLCWQRLCCSQDGWIIDAAKY